nr:MAG TPA: hypothetical protein [Caudoviricetes sp.]
MRKAWNDFGTKFSKTSKNQKSEIAYLCEKMRFIGYVKPY